MIFNQKDITSEKVQTFIKESCIGGKINYFQIDVDNTKSEINIFKKSGNAYSTKEELDSSLTIKFDLSQDWDVEDIEDEQEAINEYLIDKVYDELEYISVMI